MGNIRALRAFYQEAKAGTLPQVSWISPDLRDSEHGPALVSAGQAYVTRVINAVMRGPDWSSSAILLTWDESGGYYDHVAPKQVDHLRYGFRVPMIALSPFTKNGTINHDVMDHTSILKFIATNWNLPPLTPRESNANDMFGLFRFP